MASSTASAPSRSPSPPPQPFDIDTSGIPALVSWDLADGTTEYLEAVRGGSSSSLCRPRLHIRYESASRSALFKLQLPVLLRPRRNKSKNTAQFFLFMPPENIATLSIAGGQQDTPEAVRNIMPADHLCLRFALSTPPTVVAPPAPDRLVPKNERSAGVLTSLLDLARQTNLAIYIPHRALDQPRLQTLCTAASGHGLASIDYHSTASLYGGKGGRVLEALMVAGPPPSSDMGISDTAAGPHATTDSPPSYNELGPAPPLEKNFFAGGSSSLKRPRRSTSDSDSGGCGPPSPSRSDEGPAKRLRAGPASQDIGQYVGNSVGVKQPEQILHSEQSEQTKQMDRRIEQMEQRLAARLDGRLDRFEKVVREQLQEHKRMITEMVEERMDAHEEQTQTDLAYLRREVESDVEEQLIGKKAELDEQFKDEREDIKADLEERFADLERSISERFSSARAVLEFDC